MKIERGIFLMKRLMLILSLALNTTYCTPKSKHSEVVNSGRKLASINEVTSPAGLELQNYPSSFLLFFKNQPQRLKVENTIKQYSHIIPKKHFNKMLELSRKVEDHGISLTRKGNDMVLSNGTETLNITLSGQNTILATILGKTYNFTNSNVLSKYLETLEKNIESNQKVSSSLPTNSLFGFCSVFDFLFLSQEANAAIPTSYLIFGGMVLISIAVVVAANRATKNLKNTKHKVTHELGGMDKVNKSIDDLTKAVEDIKIDLSGNKVDVNVDKDGIDVNRPNSSGYDIGIE